MEFFWQTEGGRRQLMSYPSPDLAESSVSSPNPTSDEDIHHRIRNVSSCHLCPFPSSIPVEVFDSYISSTILGDHIQE